MDIDFIKKMAAFKPKTIAIIGGTGQMGQTFARLFKKDGYEVILASRNTKITCEEAAAKGDVVIITVPINYTLAMIKRIGKYVRKDALLTDFTSIKILPVKAMLRFSKCNVIGGHPVFGPMKSIEKQNFVLCPARSSRKWLQWYSSWLNKQQAEVIMSTADEHDKAMAVIQCLRHGSTVAFGETLRKSRFDMEKNKKFMSPIYEIRMDMAGRLFYEDPELYADILMMNPYSKKILAEYQKSLKQLQNQIKLKQRVGFVNSWKKVVNYFGGFTKEAWDNTNYLIKAVVKRKKK